jgi:hypothetical protein
MKKLMTAGLSLSAAFTALEEVRAYVNYPWCIVGDTRGIDCVFSTEEQCRTDGRNRGVWQPVRQKSQLRSKKRSGR